MSEQRLYAVPLSAHRAVGVDIGPICWGSCGKGAIGAINLDNDSAIPCREAECPHLVKQMDTPMGTVPLSPGGREEPVYLRRIGTERSSRGGSK